MAAIDSGLRTEPEEHQEDLKHVLDAARGALDQEFDRAERYDAKARGQMTLAGSWFAVVQAVAAVALRPETPRGWIVAIAVSAVAAAIALFCAMKASAGVWKLRTRPAINQETLEDMLDAAEQRSPSFRRDVVTTYRNLLGFAQQKNAARATALEGAQIAWWFALGLAFLELAVALASRIATSG